MEAAHRTAIFLHLHPLRDCTMASRVSEVGCCEFTLMVYANAL